MHQSTESAFLEAYQRLNTAQRLAVDTIEGPVMVVAGPGTGKTQILTLRIANILRQTQMDPGNILALTFTESGVTAMKERLRTYIGVVAYQVPIYTFHGFANKLISEYPEAYDRVVGGRAIADIEKFTLIETILQDGGFTLLRPLGSPRYYVAPIIRMIGQLKQEYVTPDGLAALIADQELALLAVEQYHTKGAHKGKVRGEYTKLEQSIAKNRELLGVYRQYEASLVSRRWFDFEDMIIETIKAMSTKEAMLRDLQERYQYILADEHQDVNGAQNKILELLASFHDQPNLFAVGDEKQAIYRFQGASLENFLYFTEQYPGTTVIQLTENYRSGQPILDTAHTLVAVEDGPLQALRVPLTAVAIEGAVVEQRQFTHQAIEESWLASAVAADIAVGISPSEIAVIVRTNREVEAIATLLRQRGIAVTATAEGDVLDHPITYAIEALMQVVEVSSASDTALLSVLHGAYWGISRADILRIAAAQNYERRLWDIIASSDILTTIGVKDTAPVLRVVSVLEAARTRMLTEPPHHVLEYLLRESGFLAYVTATDPLSGVRIVRRLYDEIESLISRDSVVRLADVAATFRLRREYNLPLTAPYIVSATEAVQVMTAHKSKGLEYHTVYVPHLTDTAWNGASKKRLFTIPLRLHAATSGDEQLEDERRLLYVAMTRAKRVLRLSVAGQSIAGKESVPSRFLTVCADSPLTDVDTAAAEADFAPLQLLEQPRAAVVVDSSVLATLLRERGFSATSLNNYLEDPWLYFFRNILRVPEIQPTHMLFGTAIHAVLEYSTKLHTATGQLPSDSLLRTRLTEVLNRLPLTAVDYARLLEKGLDVLAAYIPHLAAQLPVVTQEEYKIKVFMPTGIPELPEILLTGNIDRIDLDEAGRALRVVDYKTGKPKSRNVIEGKTKDATGSYKRQLVFYTLLLSLHGDERYLTSEGVLSFVEPDTRGRIHEEVFTVSAADVAALRQEIIQAVEVIRQGTFLSSEYTSDDYRELYRFWIGRGDSDA